MGNVRSLQDVMNDVSASLTKAAPAPAPVSGMSEMEAFIAIDPLLASLHKQYADAQATRRQSQKDFGIDDAMTDIAMDMEDSAWCVMQTRYMELRAERALMAKAQELMEEDRMKEEKIREEDRVREMMQHYHRMDVLSRMKSKSDVSLLLLWWALVLIFTDKHNPFRMFQPTHQFNRLAVAA